MQPLMDRMESIEKKASLIIDSLRGIVTGYKELKDLVEKLKERIDTLEKLVESQKTLLVDLRGQEAYDLHTSFVQGDSQSGSGE